MPRLRRQDTKTPVIATRGKVFALEMIGGVVDCLLRLEAYGKRPRDLPDGEPAHDLLASGDNRPIAYFGRKGFAHLAGEHAMSQASIWRATA